MDAASLKVAEQYVQVG
ncbi:hypothetical protein HaLaN_14338, partial [Haematococcus lacustris]